MIGYLFAGLTINFLSEYLTWRFSIRIQGIAEIPLALYFFFENEEYINIDLRKHPEENNKNFLQENINKSATVIPTIPPISNVDENPKSMKKYPSEIVKKSLPKLTESSFEVSFRNPNNSKNNVRRKEDSSRIDTIEMNNLSLYCLQTKVLFNLYRK